MFLVGASGFEPLASRTRTVRSIRAELRPARHDYTTAHLFDNKVNINNVTEALKIWAFLIP
ncbi:protein of unknown function [Brevefilum fermentans]|uniref:Uncharacterized protein n=1 Tax=Candidatus Brevifilum fermentans TaxID=1986204 RepID=A0A1Y6K768_9CHLR|nr:protein of unknown function [Brevefilum fermentans]